jgi:nucleoside-diphosphate-sugar epimerase
LRAAGHDVVNLDLRPSTAEDEVTVVGDVRSPADVERAAQGCEVIVNLAAEHRDDVQPVSLYETTNVDGARVVADVARRLDIDRIVFTSSVAVYGLDRGEPDEDTPAAPFNEYGRTKLAAEGVLSAWAEEGPARSLSIVRCSVVFGEGNRGNVYNLIRQIASRRFVMIGSGRNHKSMSYVGNVAAFLAEHLTGEPGTELVNYADKPDLTVRELVDVVHRALGKAPSRLRIPVWLGVLVGFLFDLAARVTGRTFPVSAVRVRKFCADTSVGSRRLEASGFSPPYELTDALERTIRAEFGNSSEQGSPGGSSPRREVTGAPPAAD